VGLASDLVDLVYVNNPDLSALHIVIGILKQSQNDVFYVFADVTGFSQRRRVSDAERHVKDSGQRLCQQGLPGARGTDKKNVAFLDLNVRQRIRLKRS